MGSKNIFSKMKASNKAYAKILGEDRRGDFRIASSQLKALQHNLMTTQSGLSRSLTSANARTLEAMNRIAGNTSKRTAKGVSSGASQAKNLFGAATGSVIDQQLMGAKATASSADLQATAGAKAGQTLGRAGNEAMDIQTSAAKEAGNAAKYELAEALSYRAHDDAELIAQKQEALQASRLAFAQNKAMARFQARLDAKAATGVGGEAYQAAAATLMEDAQKPGATPEHIAAEAAQLAGATNLSPEATSQLTAYASSLFDENGVNTAAQQPGATLEAPVKATVQQNAVKWFNDNQEALQNEDPAQRPTLAEFLTTVTAGVDPASLADAQAYAYALYNNISPAWTSASTAMANSSTPRTKVNVMGWQV